MSALEIALEYIARGWSPIPVPHKKKKPVGDEWQRWRITKDTAYQWFNGGPQNISVITGEASGGLTDTDLDTIEAVRAGPYFLPRTLCFGRPSKPRSHWLYQSKLWRTEAKATIPFKFITGTGKDRKQQMILELRTGGGSKGAQTVFPGSVHETGEPIAWDEKENIAQADGDDLKQRCARAASAALLAAHFPSKGARHDAGLTLGGFLSRCGFSRPDTELFAEAVTIASGQLHEKVSDVRKAAREAWDESSRPGGKARGFPVLAETFGDDVAKHVAKWLGFSGECATGEYETRRDPGNTKVRVTVPRPDAETGPVMELWDEILSGVNAAEPPMRGIGGAPIEIQCRETFGLHELTPDSANDTDDEKSRLPPPRHHLLTEHDRISLELRLHYIHQGKGKSRTRGCPANKVHSPLRGIPAVQAAPRARRFDHAACPAGRDVACQQWPR